MMLWLLKQLFQWTHQISVWMDVHWTQSSLGQSWQHFVEPLPSLDNSVTRMWSVL
jgi:hypothetical protein